MANLCLLSEVSANNKYKTGCDENEKDVEVIIN